MDGIQPFGGVAHAPSTPAVPPPHLRFGPAGPAGAASHPAPAKSGADYARAVRRRGWLVLITGLAVAIAGTLVVLRLPAVYRVEAEVTIEPPRHDPYLTRILGAGSLVIAGGDEAEKYVPDKLAMLRSRSLVDRIVRDPGLGGGRSFGPLDDPAAELLKNLYTRQVPGTHYFAISLEGRDATKVTRTLRRLLEEFRDRAREESTDGVEQSKQNAGKTLESLRVELAEIHAQIRRIVHGSGAIGPGGTSLPKERLQQVQQMILMDRVRYSDLDRNVRLAALRPQEASPRAEARAGKLARLEDEMAMLRRRLETARRTSRDWRGDPSAMVVVRQMNAVQAQIAALEQAPASEGMRGADEAETILESALAEVRGLEDEARQLMAEMKESMPTVDQYNDLVSQRELKQKQMAETAEKLSEFVALARTQKDPVRITVPPAEPILPVGPKRGLYIAAVVGLGLSLGIALACLLENGDHTVRVPELLTLGLALPLLGVVPRIRRTGKIQRGGHLWTPGVPDSVEADAYRNVRAGLLGIAGSHGRIVTLLVTSAKAGEGKSTTALNLAATCARAGERTLLVDVDLRRPSLGDVFPGEAGRRGLVDVLRGETPWQGVVVGSDLPNLDFLPTGDAGAVPIEVLGSLELRQLVLSLSRHHYDRVILDGPAILGLADCRMLGRIVDAAVMVVRCGATELRPLRRAKAVLEQSDVKLAGLVFNGLADDLDNWSSYGPNPLPPASPPRGLPGEDQADRQTPAALA